MPAEPCRLAAPAKPHSDEAVYGLALSKYGPGLLIASSGDKEGEGILNFWKVTGVGKARKVTHLSSRQIDTEIISVAFSPASPLVAAATNDGKMRVWDVSDPSDPDGIVIKHALGNEKQPVASVAFSPNGKLLASGGGDQQVVLWRVSQDDSGHLTVKKTPGALFQPQTIFSLAFSPNGETIAVGDGTGRTCLYQVENRNQIGGGACLLGHSTESSENGGITSVKFARLARGGTVLLTAGTAQPIVAWSSDLWNLGHNDRVDQAITEDVCELAGRNMTVYEWNTIFSSTSVADDRHKTCPQYPLP
jgi:WD40 repeat protein